MKRCFFALLFMGIVGLTVSGAISQVERDALIALYNSTDGDNWTRNTGWLGDPGTECAWYQVWCNSAGTSVVKLNLDSNQLSGSIPTELGNLSNLDYLYLSSNQLSGSIPTELGNLSNLDYLYLDSNQLSGSIPTELGNLSYLDRLYLDSNQLSGSIPTELGNLSDLDYLFLNSNQLSGCIPTELGNLSNLDFLYLDSNQLIGSIPTELGNLSWLCGLYLYSNQLSGSIPTELGNLSRLQSLKLYSNQLSGSIPTELGNLSWLCRLYLYSNQLSGSIPTELGNLSNLDYLYLSSNQLSGSIPTELGNLSNLDYLYLDSNQLSGSIPTELGNLSSLYRLYLYSNQLRGSIPTELGNLSSLYRLYLYSNQLRGSIPTELGNLSNLRDLYLYSNQLRGSIPTELTNLSSLQSINIHYNALHTDDVPLQTFINTYHENGNFENTQTIAPENGAWFPVKTGGGELTWDAILYTGDTGGYEVWTATTSGGPYFYIDITADKTIDSYTFDCLGPGTTYQFILRSVTEPHSANLNRVESKFSKEVEVPTSGVRGDLDERGNLDGADPVMLGDYLAGNIDAINACNIAGDLDDNFDINCVDLVNLMYMLHDGGTPGSFSYLLPGNGASLDSDTIQVTLEWGTSLNAFSYYIYFGRNSDPPFYANTTSTSQEVVVSSGKTYYWKVYGKNANGTTASLSGTWSFSVDPAPPIPGQFTYISPADGTCFSSGTTAVTLQWNASQNTVSYDVYFGTDTIPAYHTNTTSTSEEVSVKQWTRYYWRICAINSEGVTCSGDGIWNFFNPGAKSNKNAVDLPTEEPSECEDIDQLEIFFEFERDDEENPAVFRFYKQRTDIEFKSNKPLTAWPGAPNDFLKACPNDEPWVLLPRSFLPTSRRFSHNKKYYWRNSSHFSRSTGLK